MNCFPPWARRVVAPVITLRAKFYQIRCVNILAPVINERICYVISLLPRVSAGSEFVCCLFVSLAFTKLLELTLEELS